MQTERSSLTIPVPLSNTRSTSVGQYNTANVSEWLINVISHYCSSNLLRARCYSKGGPVQHMYATVMMYYTDIDSTHFALTPLSIACLAMLADRDMSSYELLVQLPINATV